MMKHIRTVIAATAALAASAAVLAPALAQQGPGYNNQDLAGAPGEYRGQDYNRDYNRDDRDYDRNGGWNGGRQPDYNWAVSQCSRAANQEVWRDNGFSAQYDGKAPRFYNQRRGGWELHGRLRIHDQRGFSYVNAICDIGNGRGNARIQFQR
jgi:hypothetical protein